MTLRVFSFGGGVQSTAALVLAARGEIDFRTFLFANVGDDSEDPRTLDYIREHSAPYAAQHGIALHTLDRRKRDGSIETLYGRLTKEGSRSLPIPVRMDNGAPGTRNCTMDFKVRVVRKWLKAHGATKDDPATVGVGISVDESSRINNRRAEPYERPTYPLVDLHLNRSDCARIIRSAGLPVPPKSSCYFCPFHRPSTWAEMREERPDLFDRAAALENTLNERRTMLGKDPVWLTRFAAPLTKVIPEGAAMLPFANDEDETQGQCDNGMCWT